MEIEFIEERELLSGERVKIGDIRDFEEGEARAFVANGVAKFTGSEINTLKEVSDNG